MLYRIISAVIWLLSLFCVGVWVYSLFLIVYISYVILFEPIGNGMGIGYAVAIAAMFFSAPGIPFFYPTTRGFWYYFKQDARADGYFRTVVRWFILTLGVLFALLFALLMYEWLF